MEISTTHKNGRKNSITNSCVTITQLQKIIRVIRDYINTKKRLQSILSCLAYTIVITPPQAECFAEYELFDLQTHYIFYLKCSGE